MSPTTFYMDRSEGGVLPNIQAVLLPSNTQVDCTVSKQATALFRATIFFQTESKLLFYQLTKVYSYEPQPPSHWFILVRFLYFEFHPVQYWSSNY